MTTPSTRSVPRRIVGVVAAERTYRNLAYLFLRFPLGIAYFSLFLTGLTLGIVLIPLLVGIPILIGVLGAADYAGVIEAQIATALLDVDAVWEPTDAGELSMIEYAKAVVTSPRHYALVVYFLAQFLVGVVAFVALTTGLIVPLALLVAPLVYWLPGVRYQLLGGDGSMITLGPMSMETSVGSGGFDMIVIDTLPEALVASVVGALVLLIALHLFNGVARLLGRLTVAIFDSTGQNR
ncbi:sensor domain-containing protein [Halorhabdus amylolytica]|uniref:sensor domain-containing protein n=1 Tax=Halorhabdus amylolytica TaxID=2559573 RepID=UPI0010AA65BB|nr:sensor domain-containing protein [Halorhabdus amylolytica]